MQYCYNVEVQMLGECERTYDLDERLGTVLGFSEDDIDEREPYRMTVLFSSETTPRVMRERIVSLLDENPEIFYFDMIHSLGDLPQRVVIWGDGRVQEYRTRVI